MLVQWSTKSFSRVRLFRLMSSIIFKWLFIKWSWKTCTYPCFLNLNLIQFETLHARDLTLHLRLLVGSSSSILTCVLAREPAATCSPVPALYPMAGGCLTPARARDASAALWSKSCIPCQVSCRLLLAGEAIHWQHCLLRTAVAFLDHGWEEARFSLACPFFVALSDVWFILLSCWF